MAPRRAFAKTVVCQKQQPGKLGAAPWQGSAIRKEYLENYCPKR
jgi:hypothetical protein